METLNSIIALVQAHRPLRDQIMESDEDGSCASPKPSAPRVSEIPQRGLYRLVKKGGIYTVEHKVTQERVPLVAGHVWSLCASSETDRVYAWSRSADPVWMSKHMRSSLWSVGDRVLVSMRAGDSGEPASSHWLADAPRVHKVDWIDVSARDAGQVAASVSAKVYVLEDPRERAMVFWELEPFREFLDGSRAGSSGWFRQAVRKSWWPWVMTMGVLAEHFVPGQCGNRNDIVQAFAVHRNSTSTWSLLMMIRRWSTTLDNPTSRHRAMCLFAALIGMVPKSFSLEVKRGSGSTTVDAEEYVDVRVSEGTLASSKGLQGAGSSDSGIGWPYVNMALHAVCGGGSIAHPMLVAELLRGLATLIEHEIIKTHTKSTDVLAKVLKQGGYYIDPDIKAIMHQVGRNPFRTSKMCKALQLRCAGNAYRQQLDERTRYWLQMREIMSASSTFATSVDATRFSGRDWQAGPICAVGAQQYAWMPHVVLSRKE